jgi:drug/metabolite transporter (DMT)-like permease
MIAILGGLGAALSWATSTLIASRTSRMIGSTSVTAWMMLFGLVITVPLLLIAERPTALEAPTVVLLGIAGGGNLLGLLFEYTGFRFGHVGVVATLASTEGAVAAILAVALGETLKPGVGLMLAVVMAGVVVVGLAGVDPAERPDTAHHRPGRAFGLGVGAALAFGASLYATGRVGLDLPIAWAILPARLMGSVAIGLPLRLMGRLRITRQAIPWLVFAAACEVVGFSSVVIGSRNGLAVTAVLASQFAALAAVGAYFLFRERITGRQLVGLIVIVAGVTVLSALQA